MGRKKHRRSLIVRLSRHVPDRSSFFVRLLLGLVALILLTTLSAGVPAYLVTRGQLQRQARQHLNDVRQSSVSLYLAEYGRLANQLASISEHQVFQRLATEFSSAEMEDYLEASRQQRGLDVLVYCGPGAALVSRGMDLAHCPPDVDAGFRLLAGRPAQVVTRQATLGDGEDWYTLLGAIWLTEPFLRQMAANTGAEHGLLLVGDLRRLVSSQPNLLPVGPEAAMLPRLAARMLTRTDSFVLSDDQRFLTTVFPLTGVDDQIDLLAEITLPIDELSSAEQRAGVILIASTTLVAILGVMAGALYIRRLTAPLQRLTGAAERVSQGDFATPLPEISGPSEATTLAVALRRSQAAMVEALEERSQARDWLNTLIQSIVEGVITLDATGRITFMSQGAERIMGCSSQAGVGQSINALLHLPAGSTVAFLDQVAPDGERR
jgi:PAS domain-containing protein